VEADFIYVPAYGACFGLDRPSRAHQSALDTLLHRYGPSTSEARPRLLLLFTCEAWKLRGWEAALRHRSVAAVVESRPLVTGSGSAETAILSQDHLQQREGAARPQNLSASSHCWDCFLPGSDFAIPSAVSPVEAARLRSFARKPLDRRFLMAFHGEHAGTKHRADVAEGYLEVNETVRLDILTHLQHRPNVSVGGPAMGYSFFMGNSHFCLIPRGRGFWTVRLFEAFLAGCIPVLLTDAYRRRSL